jgi:hypothetical protein
MKIVFMLTISLPYAAPFLWLSTAPACGFSSFVVPAPGMGVYNEKVLKNTWQNG